MEKTYILEGNPIALQRARYSRTSGFYDSQRDLKIHAQLHLAYQHRNTRMFKGPLALYVTFYMPIPKTWAQKRRLAINGQYHSGHIDLDNCLKYIGDIGNGCLYADDSKIAVISARKIYGMAASTVFTVVELDEVKTSALSEEKCNGEEDTEANKKGS